MFYHTERRRAMVAAKVAVTIEEDLLREVDRWVAAGDYPNRSRAVQAGLRALKDSRGRRRRLLRELAKLDPREEQALSEEMLRAAVPPPPY